MNSKDWPFPVGSGRPKQSNARTVQLYNVDGTAENEMTLTKTALGQYEEGFTAGAPFEGRYARIGPKSHTILVVESYSQAQILHHETGYGVAVAFFPENFSPVCQHLLERHPDTNIVICALASDVPSAGHNVAAALDAASKNCVSFAALPGIYNHASEEMDLANVDLHRTIENAKIPGTNILDAATTLTMLNDQTEMWSRPVNGQALLEHIQAVIKKYVVLPQEAILASALWVLYTYVVDAFDIAPILALCSPEKRCGKTTVAQLLSDLAYRPMLLSNTTPAGLYQAMDGGNMTIVIDEGDTFFGKSAELVGIINAGHLRKTAHVKRGSRDGKQKSYNVFGPKIIAMIDSPPPTIEDRSIMIWLRRKKQVEEVQRLRNASKIDFIALRALITRWANDNRVAIRNARPALPELSSDRAIDNWEPLLAIASRIGVEVLARAKSAAFKISEARVDDTKSAGEELLFDIQMAFSSLATKKISTIALISELCRDNEKPWATFDKGKPITARQISEMLLKYGIKSKNIRLSNDEVRKGFEVRDFEDAFARYAAEKAVIK